MYFGHGHTKKSMTMNMRYRLFLYTTVLHKIDHSKWQNFTVIETNDTHACPKILIIIRCI